MSGDDQVLSQAEVENLLSAMDTGAVAPAVQVSSKPKTKISPYDFKRPERVGKEQMRALQSLHEGFGRNFGASLSALLRTVVEVKLTSVDQLTFSEFVFGLENPTCFILLNADPLKGNLILDINPSILFPMIDRMLGGGSEPFASIRRPLTEIERRLVARVTGLFLNEMESAWSNVIPLNMSVERIESNPLLVSIVPPNEVVVLIGFELAMNGNRGMINLCIPFNCIERFSSTLVANSWQGYGRGSQNDESVAIMSKQMEQSDVELVITLAESKITTAELLGLRVGDIITTRHDVKDPLTIQVGGSAKFNCTPGALKGHKAVEIDSVIELPEPISQFSPEDEVNPKEVKNKSETNGSAA